MVGDIPLRFQADMDLEVDADGLLWGVRRLGTDENAFCALTWSDEARLPGHAGEAAKRGLRDRAGLAALARARQVPRPPLAR